MKLLNVGLIGSGCMGQHLASQCQTLENVRITAISDPNQDSLDRALEKLQPHSESPIQAFCSHQDLLKTEVDAVIIASPNDLHKQQTIDAAERGKHVFCEKPMALSVEDCDLMIQAADSAGVKLMPGQVLRLIPLYWQTHDIVTSGAIGKPFAMSVRRISSCWFGPSWRNSKQHAGGVVFEIHVHELDFMRQIMGEAESVHALMGKYTESGLDYEDTVFIQIKYKSGGIGQLHGGLSSAANEYKMLIQGVDGTLGNERSGDRLQYCRFGNSEEVTDVDNVAMEEPYRHELRSWVEAILYDTPMVFTAADGRAAIELAQAAYRSAELGQAVHL